MKSRINRDLLIPLIASVLSLVAFIYIYLKQTQFGPFNLSLLIILLVCALNALLFGIYKQFSKRVDTLELKFLTVIWIGLSLCLVLISVATVLILVSL
ncbi:hypothetical protein EPJ90_03945 [Erysipelothrix sp. strain 2 (EsS2-7-Brazil)]|uniref:hypothetical protein n=1 Tax=Erysipelothrix sp. strain 2 (EsS2-7-Brazil) TaxID=2500579 RepID=UPI00190CE9D0|nr:hypothetical protein [Erysipelothrix sp. strain 2 (EsS2-7-Brazil)]MBK2403990.1 hypothetical protein [Erysipelothrix sp. strain 2 (EsS2-7-Brazil)]